MGKKATVFGSFVVDLMTRSERLPIEGETIIGSFFRKGAGGKGFNQGVAAHKSGANIFMVTKLGKDTFSEIAIESMKKINMNPNNLLFSDTVETGSANIMVSETTGANKIVVVPGACNTISEEEVLSKKNIIEQSEYILLQLEINIEAIEKIINLSHELNKKIILNPAPARKLEDEFLKKIYIITPNETEAEVITGIKVVDEKSAHDAAQWFLDRGIEIAIITMGDKGAYILTKDYGKMINAFNVDTLDTTGAGDAFNGGLLTALCEDKPIIEAIKFANAVAALSVQTIGTTVSMPWREEVEIFIEKYNK